MPVDIPAVPVVVSAPGSALLALAGGPKYPVPAQAETATASGVLLPWKSSQGKATDQRTQQLQIRPRTGMPMLRWAEELHAEEQRQIARSRLRSVDSRN
ncbi:hypothetical protein ACFY0Z_31385 [Streptomyces kronopolitis]|uniref:hypothetical protein n=1 Tax=Streptomyces kronopolitis TaxID=1612435 RepID=UPI0036CBD13A